MKTIKGKIEKKRKVFKKSNFEEKLTDLRILKHYASQRPNRTEIYFVNKK